MSLADLGNVGELIGAVGVVASLIYLATQIRGARSVAIAQNARDIFDGLRSALALIAADADLTRIWQVGLTDVDALSHAERLRFQYLLSDHLFTFREAQIAHSEGVLSAQDYGRVRAWVAMLLNSAGGSHIWDSYLHRAYSEDITEELRRARSEVPDVLTVFPLMEAIPEVDAGAP